MPDLPPLQSIRAFEAAARHDSFIRAAQELGLTAATISHRVQALERHIGARLFSRHARGVRLNVRGREYAAEIRRIFAELGTATERHREHAEATHLKLVAVEVVAEKWLMPRLANFRAAHPDISIEFETDHREVDPDRRDFDVWIAFTDRVAETLQVETLFEETLLPVIVSPTPQWSGSGFRGAAVPSKAPSVASSISASRAHPSIGYRRASTRFFSCGLSISPADGTVCSGWP